MNEKQAEKWRQTRERGFRAWVLQRGILSWGLPMLCFFVSMQFARHQGDITGIFLRNFTICLIAGTFFGASTWYVMEWQYQRYLDKNKSSNESAP